MKLPAPFILVWVVGLEGISGCHPLDTSRVAVAYSSEGTLHLMSASGKQIREVTPTPPIGEFAISSTGDRVIFRPPEPDAVGGVLYDLAVATGRVKAITRGAYVFRDSRGAEPEAYGDPDISPSNDYVVFVVHPQATGDSIQAAGPLAVLNLKTGAVRVLPATTDVTGQGFQSLSDPRWSPDGKWILVNLDATMAVVDSQGVELKELTNLVQGQGAMTAGLGWLGPQCIVYVAGSEYGDLLQEPPAVLNLRTGRSTPLARTLDIPESSTIGMIAYSSRLRVRAIGTILRVDGEKGNWTIPASKSPFTIRALGTGGDAARTPAECK